MIQFIYILYKRSIAVELTLVCDDKLIVSLLIKALRELSFCQMIEAVNKYSNCSEVF